MWTIPNNSSAFGSSYIQDVYLLHILRLSIFIMLICVVTSKATWSQLPRTVFGWFFNIYKEGVLSVQPTLGFSLPQGKKGVFGCLKSTVIYIQLYITICEYKAWWGFFGWLVGCCFVLFSFGRLYVTSGDVCDWQVILTALRVLSSSHWYKSSVHVIHGILSCLYWCWILPCLRFPHTLAFIFRALKIQHCKLEKKCQEVQSVGRVFILVL